MTRVPRNKGSYSQRKGGTVQVKYPMGWNESKKKYDEYREDVPSEAEAISLIKEINDFVYHGGNPAEVPSWRKGVKAEEEAVSLTVSEFAEEFDSLRRRQNKFEPRTLQSDKERFARVKPYIGDLRLTEVATRDIDEALASMASEGPDNLAGHRYSGTTCQKTYSYLSKLFSKAFDYGYVAPNPMLKATKPSRDTKEKKFLSAEEAQALFSQIVSEPLSARPIGVLICLSCGLRESEMLALTWNDYNSGCMSITKSLVREKQAYKATKNGEERLAPCPPPLISVLDDWKRAQQEWFEQRGLQWSESSPIVQSLIGNHLLQRSFTKWFAKERLRYPVPSDFTVHGLRHTFVTLESHAGVDSRTLREMSGHKTEQAFSTYTHTNNEQKQKAALQIGSILVPDETSVKCSNCKFWTMSPGDATKGACWADHENGLEITPAVGKCVKSKFALKLIRNDGMTV